MAEPVKQNNRFDRLVYLLDHEYTPHALAWNRLKNPDAARAGALRQGARHLDCAIFLALADVHETWACEEEYGFRRFRWNRYDDDDEDEEAMMSPAGPRSPRS